MDDGITKAVASVLPKSETLLMVPPFAGIDRPSLGVHILQACAQHEGHSVAVLYANLVLASVIGERTYEAICYAPTTGLLGERFFASAAYNTTDSTLFDDCEPAFFKRCPHKELAVSLQEIAESARSAHKFIEELSLAIASCDYKVVGCSTTFEQTAASIALLDHLRWMRPDITTIIGGGNCEGEMAEGVASLAPCIDYVFSGESEYAFPDFLSGHQHGYYPCERIVRAEPVSDLNAIATPDFDDYYKQLRIFLPDSRLVKTGNIWLPYESSRGCWWGQKRRCTFCGINGQHIAFRQKKPDVVISELKKLLAAHPTNKVCMVDNVMPHTYFRELLPRIPESIGEVHIFYEQRPNLKLEQVRQLKSAGVAIIQPGIESLSDSLLDRMRKGVTVRQNLALLRYARSLDLWVNWNILYDFPGDQERDYDLMLRILPLISHFHPPTGLFHLSIDRFSTYFDETQRFGIRRLRPMPSYKRVLPAFADTKKIAYHFIADYESGAKRKPSAIDELRAGIEKWRSLWSRDGTAPPALALAPLNDDTFLLLDKREAGSSETFRLLGKEEARLIVTEQRIDHAHCKDYSWALRDGLVIELDGYYVPLVTASYSLLAELQ